MRQSVIRTVTVLSLLSLHVGISAQKKPDFSGTWVLVTPADSAGQKLTITQTAESVKLEYSSKRGKEAAKYNLDGTPSRRTIRNLLDSTAQVVSRASWKDEALVVEETYIVDGRATRSMLVLSLEPTGALVLVHERPLIAYSDTPVDFPEAPRKLVFAKQ